VVLPIRFHLKQGEQVRESFLREYHVANSAKTCIKSVAYSMFCPPAVASKDPLHQAAITEAISLAKAQMR